MTVYIENFPMHFAVHVCKKFKNQSAASQFYGVSPAFVSSVLKGRKAPNKAILEDMGLERRVVYASNGAPIGEA